MTRNAYILSIFIFLISLALPRMSFAQLEFLKDGYEDVFLKHDEGPGAVKDDSASGLGQRRFIYEQPDYKTVSHLYWGVNLYKTDDDRAVDNYMRINECNIYDAFKPDDLEWSKIRDATRNFLEQNKSDFPTRFEFSIPLLLGDYDEERKAFEISQRYKIKTSRRFEFKTHGWRDLPCFRGTQILSAYPTRIIMEYSRPFSIDYVPVDKQYAIDYIDRVKTHIKNTYREVFHNSASVHQKNRTAYLFLKTKIFTHGKLIKLPGELDELIQMIGVLEGYDIYEDIDKTRLMYSENYVANKASSKEVKVGLQEQYDILMKKNKGKGILH